MGKLTVIGARYTSCSVGLSILSGDYLFDLVELLSLMGANCLNGMVYAIVQSFRRRNAFHVSVNNLIEMR